MLLPAATLATMRANCERLPWAAATRAELLKAAAPWRALDDATLWALMYGPRITRAWMVWSNGHCPACRGDVPMYNWKLDALGLPWKVSCPHCQAAFPTNDFAAYHRSGLDAQLVFDPTRADRKLLFNAAHPDPADPLHRFGVDDGEGYVDGKQRWRFIGTYLVYGQWKQAVLGGIRALANAYSLTGDRADAHRALVLLDRVADLYPDFDFKEQGTLYEGPGAAGYVSTWHDACEETRELALAYDLVRDAVDGDPALVAFLAAQARRAGLANPKATPADVRRNIEERILGDAITNHHKIRSNYPRTDVALAVLHLVLGGADHEAKAAALVDDMVARATAVDGVTGEKGLAGYSSYTINGLAQFLAQYDRRRPGALAALLARHPKLRRTWRFHLDTWCGMQYYPRIGDTGSFAARDERYVGLTCSRQPGLYASLFQFLWDLYAATGDVGYVQALYHANGGKVDGLPYDLGCADPAAFQAQVAAVIAKEGAVLAPRSVDLPEWHLALLRAGPGAGPDARTAWLAYDTGGGHGHANGLHLGLFAKGLDLLPDFGYPPVQFGGWGSPRAKWYYMTAAHHTVTVDHEQMLGIWRAPQGGQTTLWGPGREVSVMRVSAPECLVPSVPTQPYELGGHAHEEVGLYLNTPGRVSGVRIYTKPEPPAGTNGPGAGDWQLAFRDDFARAELGPDWQVLEGQWRVENGWLVGQGLLLCTRRFAGGQRLEFRAVTDAATPCDLSGVLAAEGEQGYRRAAFFGFGSNHNVGSKLVLQGAHVLDTRGPGTTIVAGRVHELACERDGTRLRHWADGKLVQEFENNAAGVRRLRDRLVAGRQYERTVAMVATGPADGYLVDVFRVVGGKAHHKFLTSHFGRMTTTGLALRPVPEYGHETQMRDFRGDPAPAPGWQADFACEDRYRYLPAGADVHLRYTDLSTGVSAAVCEGWVCAGSFNVMEQQWVPRLMVAREGGAPLVSAFVAVLEPYERTPLLKSMRRLAVQTPAGEPYGDTTVAVEVTRADGARDLIVAADIENVADLTPAFTTVRRMVIPEWDLETDAELLIAHRDASSKTTLLPFRGK